MNMSQNDLQSDPLQNPRVTWEGCSMLLDINDSDRLVFSRLTPGSTVKIGSKNFSLRPFVSLFQTDNGKDGPCLSRLVQSAEGCKSICETYFKKYPAKIGFLRLDVLSLLLSMFNITENSDILVLDMVGGLVTGAVAECLGGIGYVCNTYLGGTPYSMDIVRMFNFTSDICKRIVRAPLNVLSLAQNQIPRHTGADGDGPDVKSNGSTSSISMEEVPQSSEHEIANLDHTASVSPSGKMGKALKAGERAPQEALKSWKEHGFSK